MAVLYGMLNQSDLGDRRIATLNQREVDEAMRLTFAEYNRELNAINETFVRRTTDYQTLFKTARNARLQPLSENGRALPVKPYGEYTVGWPLHLAGHAWGANYVTRQQMTVREFAREVENAQQADMNWMRDHILAALFYVNTSSPAPWTYVDPKFGSISVYGLADGDTITYPRRNGVAPATDDHVLGSGSVDVALFTAIYSELTEHPENSGQIVAFVPTASKSTVEGLTGFVSVNDPNLSYASTTTTLSGTLGANIPGVVFGYIEGVWVAEWPAVPDNYLIAVAMGGERPLAMREYPEPELQGFNMVAERENHPWWERQFLRAAGFGAWNRVGAVVYRTNNATYAIPTGFTSPMA